MRNIKDPENEWKMMGKSDGPKKFYQQTGLTKGEKYSFRVYSVNKAGPSGPSEPTPYATARKRKNAMHRMRPLSEPTKLLRHRPLKRFDAAHT